MSVTTTKTLRVMRGLPDVCTLREGADGDAIAAVEEALDKPLPAEMIDVWTDSDGLQIHPQGLTLYRLADSDDADDLSVQAAADMVRSWDWPVPDELLIIGEDADGTHLGVWLPDDETERCVVVALAESFDEPGLAVLGSSLAGYLAARVADAVQRDCPPGDEDAATRVRVVLDALGVPGPMRVASLGEDEPNTERLLSWASPDLPDKTPDPYERSIDPKVITQLVHA